MLAMMLGLSTPARAASLASGASWCLTWRGASATSAEGQTAAATAFRSRIGARWSRFPDGSHRRGAERGSGHGAGEVQCSAERMQSCKTGERGDHDESGAGPQESRILKINAEIEAARHARKAGT